MQAATAQMRCGGLVGLDVVVGHVGQERTGLGAELTPLLGFLVGEQGLQGHVEADHGHGCAGAEQTVGCVWIL